mmetsp:Transcript_10001/g.21135  ORF Transcript_10001/g.21135 Transcript_10001/m.21135 type:complete len:200 (-) Transcript_10001:114-713(-)
MSLSVFNLLLSHYLILGAYGLIGTPSFSHPPLATRGRCRFASASSDDPPVTQPRAPPPPPPPLQTKALPVMLAGGLFLFGSSVDKRDRAFADEVLSLAQDALRMDPAVSMELGQGVEAGGVYASSRSTATDGAGREVDQIALQFQVEGGNAWAQAVAYGVRYETTGNSNNDVRLVSLQVANMDATMSGTASNVAVPFYQ